MLKSLRAIIILVYFLILVSEDMDKFEPPSSMSFDGNVAENWDVWKQELELYLVATENRIKLKHRYYFTVLVSREERFIILLHGLLMMTD